MMTPRAASSENDVLYEFALCYTHPDPRMLDEFVRAHPAHADALTTLALAVVGYFLWRKFRRQSAVAEH